MKKIFTSILFAALALTASAQLAYNQAFTESDFNNSATIVSKGGDCGWDNTNGIRLGGSSTGIGIGGPSWNWDDKFVVIALEAGHSKSLSFTTDLTSNSVTGSQWYVATGSSQDNLTTVWETNDKNPGNVSVDLDKSVRYVKICFSGNFAGYVKDLIVSGTKAVVTYGYAEATVCPSELPYSFMEQEFTESGSVTLSGANIFGLDSIITLTLNVLPSYTITETLTIEEGADSIWHDQSLALYEEGEYTLYDSLTTEQGCDSVFVLMLTVTPAEVGPSTALQQQTVAPAAVKVLRNGVLYIRRDDVLFDLRGQRVED